MAVAVAVAVAREVSVAVKSWVEVIVSSWDEVRVRSIVRVLSIIEVSTQVLSFRNVSQGGEGEGRRRTYRNTVVGWILVMKSVLNLTSVCQSTSAQSSERSKNRPTTVSS